MPWTPNKESLWDIYDSFHRNYAAAPIDYKGFLQALSETVGRLDTQLTQIIGGFSPDRTEASRVYLNPILDLDADWLKQVADTLRLYEATKGGALTVAEKRQILDDNGLWLPLEFDRGFGSPGRLVYLSVPGALQGTDYTIDDGRLRVLNPGAFASGRQILPAAVVDYGTQEAVWGDLLHLPNCSLWYDRITYGALLTTALRAYYTGPRYAVVDQMVKAITGFPQARVFDRRHAELEGHSSRSLWRNGVLDDNDAAVFFDFFSADAAGRIRMEECMEFFRHLKPAWVDLIPYLQASITEDQPVTDRVDLTATLDPDDTDVWVAETENRLLYADTGKYADDSWLSDPDSIMVAPDRDDIVLRMYDGTPLLTDEGYFADTLYPTIYDTDAHYLRTAMEELLMDTDFTTDASAPAEWTPFGTTSYTTARGGTLYADSDALADTELRTDDENRTYAAVVVEGPYRTDTVRLVEEDLNLGLHIRTDTWLYSKYDPETRCHVPCPKEEALAGAWLLHNDSAAYESYVVTEGRVRPWTLYPDGTVKRTDDANVSDGIWIEQPVVAPLEPPYTDGSVWDADDTIHPES